MEPQNKNKQLTRIMPLEGFEVFTPTHAGKTVEVITRLDREGIKMYLIAMFTEMGTFFKVQQKMEPIEVGKMVLMIIEHDTYKSYTIEQYNDFCGRVKMGTLKGSDGKQMKIYNRFDVPMIFEMLGSFNGEIEAKRELLIKDEKHSHIQNTRKLIGDLFNKFKELGLGSPLAQKKKVDKEKSREALRHYNNFLTLVEVQKSTDNKIEYNGKRINSSEYLIIKTQL